VLVIGTRWKQSLPDDRCELHSHLSEELYSRRTVRSASA
jgi:hypothetical protein